MPLPDSLQMSQGIQLLISLCLHRASEATSVQFPIFHPSGSMSKTLNTISQSSQAPNHAFRFFQLPVLDVLVLHSLGCYIWLSTLFLLLALADTMSLDGINLFQRVGRRRRRLEFWFCEQTCEWASFRWPQPYLCRNGVHQRFLSLLLNSTTMREESVWRKGFFSREVSCQVLRRYFIFALSDESAISSLFHQRISPPDCTA